MRCSPQNWFTRGLVAALTLTALTGCDPQLSDLRIRGENQQVNDPAHAATEFRHLRFVSYNVWGLPHPIITDPTRFTDLERLVPTVGADVIAFQETFTADSKGLARLEGYPFHAYGPGKKFPKLSSGLLTVSRYPIVASAQMLFSRCAGTDCAARKGALFTRIAIEGLGEVDVFNTHMNAAGDHELREYQAKEFFRFIMRYSGPRPLVVMGDFNFSPESQPYYKFLHFLGARDAHTEYVEKTPDLSDVEKDGYTADPRRNIHIKNQDHPPERIDFIFIRDEDHQGVQVAKTHLIFDAPVNGRHLSDHFGVMSELGIEVTDSERDLPLAGGSESLSDILALNLF